MPSLGCKFYWFLIEHKSDLSQESLRNLHVALALLTQVVMKNTFRSCYESVMNMHIIFGFLKSVFILQYKSYKPPEVFVQSWLTWKELLNEWIPKESHQNITHLPQISFKIGAFMFIAYSTLIWFFLNCYDKLSEATNSLWLIGDPALNSTLLSWLKKLRMFILFIKRKKDEIFKLNI